MCCFERGLRPRHPKGGRFGRGSYSALVSRRPLAAAQLELRPPPSSAAFFYLDDLVGHHAVRLAMHGFSRLLAGRLHEAEDLAGAFVEPVAEILDAVLLMDRQVAAVGIRGDLGRQSVDLVVHVQVKRHSRAPLHSAERSGMRHLNDSVCNVPLRARASPAPSDGRFGRGSYSALVSRRPGAAAQLELRPPPSHHPQRGCSPRSMPSTVLPTISWARIVFAGWKPPQRASRYSRSSSFDLNMPPPPETAMARSTTFLAASTALCLAATSFMGHWAP